jgi:hypothetical protein
LEPALILDIAEEQLDLFANPVVAIVPVCLAQNAIVGSVYRKHCAAFEHDIGLAVFALTDNRDLL